MAFSDHLPIPPLTSLRLADITGGAIAATTLVLLLRKYLQSNATKNGLPLPPGPPAKWFWESELPTTNIALSLSGLINQYGPVISLRRGSYVTVVIGRLDVATEIMENEGGSLVDRPTQVAVAEILSGGMRLFLESSGDRFRRMRRAVHTHFRPMAVQTYQDIQTETAKGVILDILNDPKHHMQHAQKFTASVILRVTYGKSSPTSNDDPEVIRIHKVIKNFQYAIYPGRYLVDHIPWLKYFPGYGKELKEFHQYELALFRDQLDRVRDEMANNIAGPSFAKALLENVDGHRLSYDGMAYLAGGLFGAGVDSTASAITVMIMAAACHPEAQVRVQEEIEEVVGKDRLPTFEDLDLLPQLNAFMLEAHRWRPAAPVGASHRASKDIIWKGLCIPAGTIVLGSHWAISRDPVAFPNPEKFDPQRWLTKDGQLRTDLRFYTFGFGRRVCPARHFANRSIYINLALLLWSVKIVERPEAPIDTYPFPNSIALRIKPFEVDFVPRVEEETLRKMMV